jgi:YVTN family beta-propeller protein
MIDRWRHAGMGLFVGIGLALALLVGCGRGTTPAYVTWASSLAASPDGKLVYAADSDNDVVVVMKAKTEAKIAQVKVGRAPERIAVGSDDTVYVANRGSRCVSVFKRNTWHEMWRIPVGVEPVGLAVSPDNKVLYVVNSSSILDPEHGTLSAVDVNSRREIWSLPVGPEPRDIRLLGSDRAEIRLRKGNEVLHIDLKAQRILGRTLLSGS